MSEGLNVLFVIALLGLSLLAAFPIAKALLDTFGVENVILFYVAWCLAVIVMHAIHGFIKIIRGE